MQSKSKALLLFRMLEVASFVFFLQKLTSVTQIRVRMEDRAPTKLLISRARVNVATMARTARTVRKIFMLI